MRTDKHNNPTAMITDMAAHAVLVLHFDYEIGDPFTVGSHTYNTARLLKDPIDLTIKVIDKLSFHTGLGSQRWTYIALPFITWKGLTRDQKRDIIGWMYQHEGGTEMRALFPNYGAK